MTKLLKRKIPATTKKPISSKKTTTTVRSDIKFINPELEIDFENLGTPTLVGDKLQYNIKGQIDELLKNAPEAPTIEFTRKAIDKVRALVREHSKEIAWHGTVRRDEHLNKITVLDILVYPQDTKATTVDAVETEYPLWLQGLPDEEFNSIRMQGHSHVNMAIGPSGTDETYYKELIHNINDFYLVMIINKRDNIMLRYYDVENNLVYSELTTPWLESQSGWALEEIEKHVDKGSTPTVQKIQNTTIKKQVDVKEDINLYFNQKESKVGTEAIGDPIGQLCFSRVTQEMVEDASWSDRLVYELDANGDTDLTALIIEEEYVPEGMFMAIQYINPRVPKDVYTKLSTTSPNEHGYIYWKKSNAILNMKFHDIYRVDLGSFKFNLSRSDDLHLGLTQEEYFYGY